MSPDDSLCHCSHGQEHQHQHAEDFKSHTGFFHGSQKQKPKNKHTSDYCYTKSDNHTHRRFSHSPSWRGIPNTFVSMTTLVIALSLTCQLAGVGVLALSCEPCDLELCTTPTDCRGGLVLDICMCCLVCEHVVNQTCGGLYGLHGKCAQDLLCFYPHEPHRGDEIGICTGESSTGSSGPDLTLRKIAI